VHDPLYTLHPKVIWRFLKTQPASFWCINAYLLFEYVRPQSIYDALEGPPWAQITILLSLATFLLEGKFFRLRTPADATLCIFSLVLVLSSVQAFRPQVAYEKVPEFFSWVLIYLLIANIVVTERRFLVFMLAFLLYSLKMSQHATRSWAGAGFAFRDWGVTGAPGWFHNSGEFGIQMVIFAPLAVHFALGLKRHWGRAAKSLLGVMVLTAVIGTIGSSSRGAMLGMAVVAIFMLAKTKHKLKGAVVLIGLAIFAAILIPEESLDRFRTMGEDGTSVSRKTYWAAGIQAMQQHPVLGIGYANWTVYMRYAHGGMGLPHNIFIQAGAELGYAGLLAFIAMIVATFVVNYRTRKMLRPLGERGAFMSSMAHGLDAALVGYLVSGSFVTVLYYPYFWINLAMTVALHNAARHAVLGRIPARPARGVRGMRGAAPIPVRAR
jgi:O-antigen ligase